jgi:AraC family ethanolamine operon transcriptional activator
MQTTPGTLCGGARELYVGGVQLLDESYRNVVTNHFGIARPGSIGFVIPLDLRSEGMFNGQTWTSTRVCMWNTDREFNAVTPPSDLVCAIIERRSMTEYIAQTEKVDVEQILQTSDLTFESRTHPKDVACSLKDLVNAGSECLSNDFSTLAVESVEQEVMEILAPIVVEHLLGKQDRRQATSHVANVRRARDVLLSSADTPMRIRDLCSTLNVSRRTLQESFQSVLGVSPLHYLRALRLNGARQDLLRGHAVKVVTETWGFWHWSRFSQEYRSLFCELPSTTLRRSHGLDPKSS